MKDTLKEYHSIMSISNNGMGCINGVYVCWRYSDTPHYGVYKFGDVYTNVIYVLPKNYWDIKSLY